MVEIASDRPLFKTILVEMAYSVIHLHNRVNKSRITILLLCLEELELGKHLRCLPWCDHRKLLAVVVIVIVHGQRRWLELLDDSLCNVIIGGHAGNCFFVRIVEKVVDFHGVAIVELMNLLFQSSDQFSGGFNFLGGGRNLSRVDSAGNSSWWSLTWHLASRLRWRFGCRQGGWSSSGLRRCFQSLTTVGCWIDDGNRPWMCKWF